MKEPIIEKNILSDIALRERWDIKHDCRILSSYYFDSGARVMVQYTCVCVCMCDYMCVNAPLLYMCMCLLVLSMAA